MPSLFADLPAMWATRTRPAKAEARGLRRIGKALRESFRVLHRIQWASPWDAQPTRDRLTR